MSSKKLIKNLLSEVAGISFEVRTWAQIIETYVSDYIKKERDKMKVEPPVQPQQPKSVSWSAPAPEDDDYGYNFDYTHFEDDEGNIYEKANIYSDELHINSDVLEDYPGIKNAIASKLFTVTLDGEGKFFVDSVGGSFPEAFRTGIEEIIADHMLLTEPFYTDDYTNVYAVSEGLEYSYYMGEGDEDKYKSYYGGYYQQPKIDKIEINGQDFPQAYKNFSVDKWVITSSNRIEYDHWRSGYDESGQYVVYLNMPMSSIGGSALVHEIKHAYDDWNRMSKGGKPIRAGWEIKNIYTPDFEKLVLGGSFKLSAMLHPIIRYYYLGSKLESPAYLENEYDSNAGTYRDTAKKMMNFKASNFLDKKGNPAKGLQESWTELIKEYDTPFFRKFKNVVDFLRYTERHFNKRGRDIMKRIDKMRYVHDRPEIKYAPKVYPKPETNQTEPVKKPIDDALSKADREIDRLEDEWDRLHSLDPKKYKEDLDDLDAIIKKQIEERNKLAKRLEGDLPF